MNWFYSPDGTQRHEVSDDALAEMARDGILTGDMLLWRDGQPDWRPAREVRPDLFGLTGAPLPPPSPLPPPPPPPPPPDGATSTPAVYAPGIPPTGTGGGYYQQVPVQRPTNSAALASLISGVIGLLGSTIGFCCCLGLFVSPIAGLVAVIFGHQVYSKSQGHPDAGTDKNMALIGLILGYITLLLTVGAVVYNLVFVGLAGMGAALEGIKSGSFNP